jgi:1-acyl-sn-glycerol-3-phosphate acyltransferase
LPGAEGDGLVFYWILWLVGHALARVLFQVSYSGGSNVPRKGPVIICANHLGWWDPVLFAMATRRRLYFMAKSELFRNPVLAFFLRAAGAFSVRRGEPDRRSISKALSLLAEGAAVGIFPEGTRSYTGKFRRAEPGVGLMLLRSGAPVVPAYIKGPYQFRGPVHLTIGPAVKVETEIAGARSQSERRQAAADAVMLRIAALGGRMADYEAIMAVARPRPEAAAPNTPGRAGQD